MPCGDHFQPLGVPKRSLQRPRSRCSRRRGGNRVSGYRDTGSRSTTRGQRSIVIVEHLEQRATLPDTLPSVLSSSVAPVTAIVAEASIAEAKCARRKISIVSRIPEMRASNRTSFGCYHSGGD